MTPEEAQKEGGPFSLGAHIPRSSRGSPAPGEALLEEQGEVGEKTLLDPSPSALQSQVPTQQRGAREHNTAPVHPLLGDNLPGLQQRL